MTPDWMQNLVPAGTSRGKLLLAAGSLVAALGVVAYDVAWMTGDDEADHEGSVAALELGPAELGPAELGMPAAGFAPDSSVSPGQASAASATSLAQDDPDAAAGMAPAGAPARAAAGVSGGASTALPGAASGPEPDWSALFAQLIARESATQLSSTGTETHGTSTTVLPDSELQARLDASKLRGVVQAQAGAIALINGRMLREGDTLPGTDFTLGSVLVDRVLLKVPGRVAPVTLLLEPMGGHTTAGAP